MDKDSPKRKDWHEDFTSFFESPTRESFINIINKHEFENSNIDYKAEWEGDTSSLAKDILAFSNTEGGCIIFGVSENKDKSLTSSGLKGLKDEAVFKNEIKNFLPEFLGDKVELVNFQLRKATHQINGLFQILFIPDLPTNIPFTAQKDGKALNADTIYFRDGSQSKPANYSQIQSIIDRRVRTNTTSSSQIGLKEDLDELKVLYESLKKYYTFLDMVNPFGSLPIKVEKNDKYPKEDFEDFVVEMIRKKKEKITKRIL